MRAKIHELHARATTHPFQSVSPLVFIAPGEPIPPLSWAPRDITDLFRTSA